MFETSRSTFTGAQVAPLFSWSYSKLKNYKSCPSRHYHYDIGKDVREPPSEALEFGDFVHKSMENRIREGKALPPPIAKYEPIVQEFLKGVPSPDTVVLVEQKFAIDKDFNPLYDEPGGRPGNGFFNKKAWFRGIADAVKIKVISDDVHVAVNWDWKTGAPPSSKGQPDDPTQILTAAAALMYHYPKIQMVRNEYVWLEYDQRDRTDLKRSQLPELWASLWGQIEAYREACRTEFWPPKKNGLCRGYCGVETCQFWEPKR